MTQNMETEEPKITRDAAISMLKTGLVEVRFTKKDGTERVMKATLNSEYLPEMAQDEAPKRSNEGGNPDLINCFDVEVDGWRCFKISSLTGIPVPISAPEPCCGQSNGCECDHDSDK